MVSWPQELPVQKFVEIFMPSPCFPCEAVGCMQGLAVGQAPAGPTPQKPFKGGDICKGQLCKLPPQKHLGPQHGSAEPDSLQRRCSGIAEERGKALSHHHIPLADNRLDMLHYIKSFSPTARIHFATQKCKCNFPI